MKRILSLLAMTIALVISAGCTKEERKVSVEQQWAGTLDIYTTGQTLGYCIDLGCKDPGKMIVAIKAGDILNGMGIMGDINWDDIDLGNLGSLGDLSNLGELGELLTFLKSLNPEDYIYSDMTAMQYTLTYTGKDSGNITVEMPQMMGGGTENIEFKDLTNASVSCSIEGTEIVLASTKKDLKKISDNIFKLLF